MQTICRLLILAVVLHLPSVFAQDGVPWVPKQQIIDTSGNPLAAGKVYTYIAGTTTNQATYTDSTRGTPNANPVVLDSAGRANIWLDESLSYRIDVKTSADVLVYTVDNITDQFQFVGVTLTVGTGTAADTKVVWDGNAQDYYWGLDDSADTLVVGLGSAVGTTPAFFVDSSQDTWFTNNKKITFCNAGCSAAALELYVNTSNNLIFNDVNDDGLLLASGGTTYITTNSNGLVVNEKAHSNDSVGPSIWINRGTNAGAEGPIAGTLRLEEADSTDQYYWTDATGDLRIHTAAPTGSSGTPTVADTAGAVVGDQTSWHGAKTRIRRYDNAAYALRAVKEVPLYQWEYRDSGYRNPNGKPKRFIGPVIYKRHLTGDGPWYAKNLGRQQLPSFDPVTSISMSFLAIRKLDERIERLEQENRELRRKLGER
jgi:hypothetical protein